MDSDPILIAQPGPADSPAQGSVSFSSEIGALKVREIAQVVDFTGSRRFGEAEIDEGHTIDSKPVASAIIAQSPVAPAHAEACRHRSGFNGNTCRDDETSRRNRRYNEQRGGQDNPKDA